jgi:hypothetical protein
LEGTEFYFKSQGGTAYLIYWDYSAAGAASVSIKGEGVSIDKGPVTGNAQTQLLKDAEYTATLWDSKGKKLIEDKMTVTNVGSNATDAGNGGAGDGTNAYLYSAGHVAGASIILPRGPAISPRGP